MGNSHGYLIGLDLGTSMIKGVLIDVEGCVVSRQYEPLAYNSSENGCVEFDADVFYHKIAGVVQKLSAALPSKAVVFGIGMASASGNTLLIDDGGKPMIPAISWMDKRVSDEVETVFGGLSPAEAYETIGWPISKTFPLAHLSWLKIHRPRLLESAFRICMSTDYVNYRMTGEWGIDVSTATSFYLQDQTAARWHAPFLEKLCISETQLPPIFASGTVLGKITKTAAGETGLAPGTPVVLGSFDHPCAARGAGVLDERQLLLSCGTSWVCFFPMPDRKRIIGQDMLVDPFLQPAGPWGAMCSIAAVSSNIDGYIKKYISECDDRYAVFDRLAASANQGADGLLINPMEISDPLRLALYTKEDIARALMEGTVFLLRNAVDNIMKRCCNPLSAIMVGGPSEAQPWPQIVCDVLNLPIVTGNGSCAGAMGAAILAGIGAKIYADEHDAHEKVSFAADTRYPNQDMRALYDEMYGRFIAATDQ